MRIRREVALRLTSSTAARSSAMLGVSVASQRGNSGIGAASEELSPRGDFLRCMARLVKRMQDAGLLTECATCTRSAAWHWATHSSGPRGAECRRRRNAAVCLGSAAADDADVERRSVAPLSEARARGSVERGLARAGHERNAARRAARARWEAVDLDGSQLAIVRTLIEGKGEPRFSEPKTKRSRRSIALDPESVTVLREHRKRQLEERPKRAYP